jgi:hypothetical protein
MDCGKPVYSAAMAKAGQVNLREVPEAVMQAFRATAGVAPRAKGLALHAMAAMQLYAESPQHLRLQALDKVMDYINEERKRRLGIRGAPSGASRRERAAG